MAPLAGNFSGLWELYCPALRCPNCSNSPSLKMLLAQIEKGSGGGLDNLRAAAIMQALHMPQGNRTLQPKNS
jgi:hypothetical protein